MPNPKFLVAYTLVDDENPRPYCLDMSNGREMFRPNPTLRANSLIARAIGRATNLSVVIPVWSDGESMNIGTTEDHHGRMEWVYRGEINTVNGVKVVTGSPEVVEAVTEILATFATPEAG